MSCAPGVDSAQDCELIDLYNFEDEKFASDDYVLTSPRSLEACRRLLIKPSELLYKPLATFRGEILHDVPLRTMYDMYDLHEQERQNKLRACRLERENIITTELEKSKAPDSSRCMSEIRKHDRRTALPADGPDIPASPAARASTTPVSLFGYPVTPTTISNADREPYPEDAVRHSSPVAKTPGNFSFSLSDPFNHRASTPELGSSADGEKFLSRSLSYMDLDSKRDQHGQERTTRRSLSMWGGSPDRQPTKITDVSLRRALRSSEGLEVTQKDKRILQAMLAKKQTDQHQEQLRSAAEFRWHEERQQLADETFTAELEKWRTFARKHKEHEHEQVKEHQRRISEESAWQMQLERQLYAADMKASERLSRLKESTDRQIEAKKHQEYERKIRQEDALDKLEQQQQLYRSRLMTRSMQDLSTTSCRREDRLAYNNKIKKWENRKRSASHRARFSSVQRQYRHNQEDLYASISLKQLRMQRNYDSILNSRDFHIDLKRQESNRRRARSLERIELMSQMMETSNQDTLKKSYLAGARANQAVQSNLLARSQAVRQSRESREKQHKNLHRRVNEHFDALQWQHASHIAAKEWKANSIQKEKEYVNYKVKTMAATAQRLREDLKKQYGADTFDKKVKEVELQSRIGQGIRSAARNASTVLLA